MTLQERVENLSDENLKALAKRLFCETADESIVKFETVLAELEIRLSENDFGAFCDVELQAAWRESEGL